MSVHHLTVDELSAYIDRELGEPELLGVESHLQDCLDCRERLDGLRSVALGLRGVERLTPPPLLEHSIRRQLSLVDREVPAWRRSRMVSRLQSNLLLLFALVIALALMVALFSDALSRAERGGSTIVAPSGGIGFIGAADEDTEPVRVEIVDGRVFEQQRDAWRERGVGPASRWLSAAEARRLLAAEAALLELWRQGAVAVVLRVASGAQSGGETVGISQATASEVLRTTPLPAP